MNETIADKLWKGRSPIGQRVRPSLSASLGTSINSWHTVVSVVRNVRANGVEQDAGTELYLFIDQPAPAAESANGPWSAQAPTMMNVALRTRVTSAYEGSYGSRTAA